MVRRQEQAQVNFQVGRPDDQEYKAINGRANDDESRNSIWVLLIRVFCFLHQLVNTDIDAPISRVSSYGSVSVLNNALCFRLQVVSAKRFAHVRTKLVEIKSLVVG